MLVLLSGTAADAQLYSARLGYPGNYLINVSFGAGNRNNDPGPPLNQGSTSFQYSNSLCPPTGFYCIARRTNIDGCFNGAWTTITTDHTNNNDYGNMMLVHDSTTNYNKFVFTDTVRKPSCSSATYEFSAAILNLNPPDYCPDQARRAPGFVFSIETLAGVRLRSYYTGRITFYGGTFLPSAYGASVYGFDFNLPAGTDNYVVKIIDSATTYGDCGYSFAIDDIKLLSVGPAININLSGLSQNDIQTSVCFQDNKTVTFDGAMDPGYTNPAVQWQQSTDSGLNWTDIPGAVNYNYTTDPLTVPGTFLFRLRGSEASDIGNPNCSAASNSIKVIVDGLPTGYSISSNSPVCVGTDLMINLSGGASYITTGPDHFFDDSPFPHVYHASFADSGTYDVQVKSEGGCIRTDSTHVVILGPSNVQVSPDLSICYGRTVQLQASGGNTYLWSPADGLSNPAIANPLATPIVTTTYKVSVTDQSGCSYTVPVVITLLDSVLKAAFTGPDIVCPNDIPVFRDASIGKIQDWNWDFDNGQTSIVQNPPSQHYPVNNVSTDYSVRLIVTDSAGCSDTAYHAIKTVNNCYINVPSAFTPNNDGHNDYLYPLNAYKATQLMFRVFNRSGQLVFETRDWTKKWDGSFNGRAQPEGTFVWTLDYMDENNKKIFLKGTTVLIR